MRRSFIAQRRAGTAVPAKPTVLGGTCSSSRSATMTLPSAILAWSQLTVQCALANGQGGAATVRCALMFQLVPRLPARLLARHQDRHHQHRRPRQLCLPRRCQRQHHQHLARVQKRGASALRPLTVVLDARALPARATPPNQAQAVVATNQSARAETRAIGHRGQLL
jgi:hypothetical protein